MTYLYGDSSPAPLTGNFIELVRDAMELCVGILLADERIQKGAATGRAHRDAAEAELARIDKLGGQVTSALGRMAHPQVESPADRAAAMIAQAAEELVGRARESVRASLAAEIAAVDAEQARERAGCVKALEKLLLRHAPPASEVGLRLEQLGGSRVYQGELLLRTPFGLEAALELEIPPTHLFGKLLRIGAVAPGLGVTIAERGWIRKGIRSRHRRLDRYTLTALRVDSEGTAMDLRSRPDDDAAGFQILARSDGAPVRLIPLGSAVERTPPLERLLDEDAKALLSLRDQLVAALGELSRCRSALKLVRFEGTPLELHPEPRRLVEQIIRSMAPLVQEVQRRSLSPTELVLKRVLADDRREEIFVTKADLLRKLEGLPESMRRLFESLSLEEEAVTMVDDSARRRSREHPAPRLVPALLENPEPLFETPIPETRLPGHAPRIDPDTDELLIEPATRPSPPKVVSAPPPIPAEPGDATPALPRPALRRETEDSGTLTFHDALGRFKDP